VTLTTIYVLGALVSLVVVLVFLSLATREDSMFVIFLSVLAAGAWPLALVLAALIVCVRVLRWCKPKPKGRVREYNE